MSEIYNVCLVPDSEFSNAVTLYSQYLSRMNHSRFVLGSSSVPHATILQFSSSRAETQILEAFMKFGFAKRISVNIAGLAFLPADNGDLWCELAILKSSELQSLQHLAIDGLKSVLEEIKSSIEDNYRPHFTVALNSMLDIGTNWVQPNLPVSLLRASNVPCELRIGRSGVNYQVTSIIR
jgi:hypothetical protein